MREGAAIPQRRLKPADTVSVAHRARSVPERRRAIQRVATLGSAAIPYLLDLLQHHPKTDARSTAATALKEVGGNKVAVALVKALDDPSMDVRLHALRSLDVIWNAAAARAVLRLLEDPSGGVRVNAVSILARHKVTASVRPLVKLLRDDKWYASMPLEHWVNLVRQMPVGLWVAPLTISVELSERRPGGL